MAIEKEYTAYNGVRCDYHAVTSFEHKPDGSGVIKMGSYRTLVEAKTRRGEVVVREIPFTGVTRSETIRHALYRQAILHPDFAGGKHV